MTKGWDVKCGCRDRVVTSTARSFAALLRGKRVAVHRGQAGRFRNGIVQNGVRSSLLSMSRAAAMTWKA